MKDISQLPAALKRQAARLAFPIFINNNDVIIICLSKGKIAYTGEITETSTFDQTCIHSASPGYQYETKY